MKKQSKVWNDLLKLLELIDLKIRKTNLEIHKLIERKNEIEQINIYIYEKLHLLKIKLLCVPNFKLSNSIADFFNRRESYESKIESLLLEISLNNNKMQDLEQSISLLELEKKN